MRGGLVDSERLGAGETLELQCPECAASLLESASERECIPYPLCRNCQQTNSHGDEPNGEGILNRLCRIPDFKCSHCDHTVLFDGMSYHVGTSIGHSSEFSSLWNLYEHSDSRSGIPIKPDSYHKPFEELLKNLNIISEDLAGLKILDVGYGNGKLLEDIQRNCPASFGIDMGRPSRSAKLNPETVFLGDLHASPFKPGQFDLVVCKGVIQHTKESQEAFSRVAEMLAEKGRLYLEVYEKGMRKTLTLRKIFPLSWHYPHFLRILIARSVALIVAIVRTIKMQKMSYTSFIYDWVRYKHRIYDDLCCRYVKTFHVEDIFRWFHESGFDVEKVGQGQYVGMNNSEADAA